MPQVSVTLSDGKKVEIQPLTWAGYVVLKEAIIRALRSPIASVFQVIGSKPDLKLNRDALTDAGLLGQLADVLPQAVKELDQIVDLCWTDLLKHAVRGELPDLQKLLVEDCLALRAAIFEATDLAKLLETEKNWWRGMISSLQLGL